MCIFLIYLVLVDYIYFGIELSFLYIFILILSNLCITVAIFQLAFQFISHMLKIFMYSINIWVSKIFIQ